jgi:hypothetical protein
MLVDEAASESNSGDRLDKFDFGSSPKTLTRQDQA